MLWVRIKTFISIIAILSIDYSKMYIQEDICDLEDLVCNPVGLGVIESFTNITSIQDCKRKCVSHDNCNFTTYSLFRGTPKCSLLSSCDVKVFHITYDGWIFCDGGTLLLFVCLFITLSLFGCWDACKLCVLDLVHLKDDLEVHFNF